MVRFASDALLYQSETVLDHIRMVKELKLPEEIEARVCNGNPTSFLGSALSDSAWDEAAMTSGVATAQKAL